MKLLKLTKLLLFVLLFSLFVGCGGGSSSDSTGTHGGETPSAGIPDTGTDNNGTDDTETPNTGTDDGTDDDGTAGGGTSAGTGGGTAGGGTPGGGTAGTGAGTPGGGGAGGGTPGSGGTSTTLATAKLGNLADANVTIYKVEDNGSLTLKWNETTSSGSTLDDIGKFDIHADEMEDDSFYLIKVKGGCDWDKDDNGIMDSNCTPNKGTIRAIAKGSDIKAMGDNFKVTLASELIFEKVAKYLYNNFNKTTFESKLNEAIQEVIAFDIDGDGDVDINDMAKFEPVDNKAKLADDYKKQFQELVGIVHSGKIPLLTINYIGINYIGRFNTHGKTESITLSKDGTKAYVADRGGGLVILDVSDPAHPTEIVRLVTNGSVESVALSKDGTKAYVANGSKGLVILDVSDPAHPSQIGDYSFIGYAGAFIIPCQHRIVHKIISQLKSLF